MWDLTNTHLFHEHYLLFPGVSEKVTSVCCTLLAKNPLCLPCWKPRLTTPSRSRAGHCVTINQQLTANWFYTCVLGLADHNLKANLFHTFNIIGSFVSCPTKPELITVHHFYCCWPQNWSFVHSYFVTLLSLNPNVRNSPPAPVVSWMHQGRVFKTEATLG